MPASKTGPIGLQLHDKNRTLTVSLLDMIAPQTATVPKAPMIKMGTHTGGAGRAAGLQIDDAQENAGQFYGKR